MLRFTAISKVIETESTGCNHKKTRKFTLWLFIKRYLKPVLANPLNFLDNKEVEKFVLTLLISVHILTNIPTLLASFVLITICTELCALWTTLQLCRLLLWWPIHLFGAVAEQRRRWNTRNVGEGTSQTIRPFHYLRTNFISLLAGWALLHSSLYMHSLFRTESSSDVVKANFTYIESEVRPSLWRYRKQPPTKTKFILSRGATPISCHYVHYTSRD